MSKKIKVLAYSDAVCATGFGTVSRNIYKGLVNTGRYELQVLGINFHGNPYSRQDFPYDVWPVYEPNDPYGRRKICSMIASGQFEFDILFFLQDSFILDFLPELMNHLKGQNRKFKSICYYPIDGIPKEQWIKNVNAVDYPVTYTNWAKEESLKAYPLANPNTGVIYHGINPKEFYPLPEAQVKQFRQQYFGANAGKFIFTNINRNQQRKDIPRAIAAFKEFKKQVPNSVLYLHMATQDQGWNLTEVCKAFGLDTASDVVFPQNFGPNQGYPREIVNLIYNASDCVVSTNLGEGWGLSLVECMACKTPVIAPRNTAPAEFITEDKGYLVNSGSDVNLWTVLPNDNEVLRPLTDINDMVKTMLHVYNNYGEAKQKAESAYKWVTTELDWQNGPITKQWIKVFDTAAADLARTSNIPTIKTDIL